MARYERIAAALRESILAGEYAPGARLPRQQELARVWQTTLPTVRQALDQLQRDGLIRVEHGVGTFVADLDQAHDPFAVASFTEALQAHGLAVETRLLAIEPWANNATATDALGATEEEGIVALTRLRGIGGRPVVLQHSYAPGRLRAELADFAGTESLYAFLRYRAGLVAGGYQETVSAESAPDTVAAVLELDAGGPILVARRTTTTAAGQPFLYDEAYLPPDRVTMTITRRGAGTSVDLAPFLATPADSARGGDAATPQPGSLGNTMPGRDST
jgi:DNA-binding GntR family transcriptional regulator